MTNYTIDNTTKPIGIKSVNIDEYRKFRSKILLNDTTVEIEFNKFIKEYK